MNEKSVVSKYLEYRENVLKYTDVYKRQVITKAIDILQKKTESEGT